MVALCGQLHSRGDGGYSSYEELIISEVNTCSLTARWRSLADWCKQLATIPVNHTHDAKCVAPTSGMIATVAVDVCTRPELSVAGTRCTRWTPLSNLSLLYTLLPFTCRARAVSSAA